MVDAFDTDGLMEYYLAERQKKQSYLIENVASKGYDATEFAQFLDYKKGIALLIILIDNGTNIDNWTFDELSSAV